jgi:hypothetical protein
MFLGFAGFLFSACSDDSTEPSKDSAGYFPSNIGSYWVYERFSTDTLKNPIVESLSEDSSVIISEAVTYLNHSAYLQNTYSDIAETMSDYFYSENYALHGTLFYVMPREIRSGVIPLPFEITDRWVKIADPNATTWDIFDTTLTNVDYSLPGIGTFKFTGTFSVKGEKKSQSVVQIGEEGSKTNVNAQQFDIVNTLEGKISGTIPVSISTKLHLYYADNIGLVKQELDPFIIDINYILGKFHQGIQGYITTLKRYQVLKPTTFH